MSTYKKSLAKVLGPVVMLTAALALPMDNMAQAAAPQAYVAKPEKEKNKQKHQNQGQRNKAQVKANPGKAKGQARAQARQQAQIQRQAEIDRQARIQRRAEVQRQAELQRQADLRAARQRATAQRQRQPVYNDRYYDNRYRNNQGRGGADRSVIAADGYLEDTRDCLILRGHQGQVYSLVGDTGGLREGDHVRLRGRLQYGYDRCGGEVLEIHQVQTIWADRNHKSTYYDHLEDGPFRGDYDRHEDDYYGDPYQDDDYYDNARYNNERDTVIAREGRLANIRDYCPRLRTDRGDFSLIGDLRNFREGDRVKVTGFLEGDSRCGQSIRVGEITRS